MPDRKHTQWMRIRLLVVAGVLVAGAGVMVWRMWTLQVVQARWLRGLAREQYLKDIRLEPMRGPIVDRNGAPLAVSVMTDSIFATPREMADTASAAAALASALEMEPVSLRRRLSSGKHFVWIKRRVTPEESARVRELAIPGVHFTRESRRFYPARELAGSIVGFAGDGRGLEGTELLFDGQLRGATVLAQGLRDARGNLLFAEGVGRHGRGGGVVLTIDLTIQEIVETELLRAVGQAGARAGTAIVMEPDTGEILAMANAPGFNPNTFWKHEPHRWRNRAVTDCYEPGSTMKVFTMAAALQRGVVQPEEHLDCERGRFEVGGHVIHDSHKPGFGELTPAEILIHSSNIGMAKLGMRLGGEDLYSALRRFGFGRRSGIDFPGESRCLLRKPQGWTEVDLATISFGQGVSVTPLQLTAALCAVANGGVFMRPRLVREVRDPDNAVAQRFAPAPCGRVLDADHARRLAGMMAGVTRPGGTGTRASVPGFEVAGKTGTAQKVDPIAGGYSKDKRVASFMGFVPARDPRIAALVVIDEPTTSPYGGVVAAPAFARIAEATLRYLKVFPDAEPVPVEPVADTAAQPDAVLQAIVERVQPGRPRPDDEPQPGRVRVPDVRHLSVRAAVRKLSRLGLEVVIHGSGRVSDQQPSPGERVEAASRVVLTLERVDARARAFGTAATGHASLCWTQTCSSEKGRAGR